MPGSLPVPGGGREAHGTELDRPSDPSLDGLMPSPSRTSGGAQPSLEQPNPADPQIDLCSY